MSMTRTDTETSRNAARESWHARFLWALQDADRPGWVRDSSGLYRHHGTHIYLFLSKAQWESGQDLPQGWEWSCAVDTHAWRARLEAARANTDVDSWLRRDEYDPTSGTVSSRQGPEWTAQQLVRRGVLSNARRMAQDVETAVARIEEEDAHARRLTQIYAQAWDEQHWEPAWDGNRPREVSTEVAGARLRVEVQRYGVATVTLLLETSAPDELHQEVAEGLAALLGVKGTAS